MAYYIGADKLFAVSLLFPETGTASANWWSR